LPFVALTGTAEAQTALPQTTPNPATGGSSSVPSADLGEIEITASRFDLLGTARSASEGFVDDRVLQLTPIYRPGQLLETVPGLTITQHSGEGKANQFILRGYNLDHGTDLETYVDGMPINQPTHAHGQGYTDLNFVIPELADRITYTKGPYYATVGDFGAVGSARISYRDTIPDQLTATVGTLGYERLLGTGTQSLGNGHLLEAVELQHYDGPFVVPDNARKENVVLRYSEEGKDNGFSLTAMFYHQDWTNTTDIPIRAISEGLVPNRFGSLDPTDGGHAMRASLSANYHAPLGDGQINASAFYIYNQLNLFNDFTHFLVDPVHGDQEDQFETRNVLGNSVDYTLPGTVAGFPNEFKMGGLMRYDMLNVGRLPSQGETPLTSDQTAGDPPSFSNNDDVSLFAGALYLQSTTRWGRGFVLCLARATTTSTGSITISWPRCTQPPAIPILAHAVRTCHNQNSALSTRRAMTSNSICRPARAFTAPIYAASTRAGTLISIFHIRRYWQNNGARRSVCGRTSPKTSPLPSRSTISGSNPRRSSTPTLAWMSPGRRANAMGSRSTRRMKSPPGWNSMALFQPTTPASPSRLTTGPAISAPTSRMRRSTPAHWRSTCTISDRGAAGLSIVTSGITRSPQGHVSIPLPSTISPMSPRRAPTHPPRKDRSMERAMVS